MKKRSDGSVAPKERINIQYKPSGGDSKTKMELPFRVLVTGDFSHKPDGSPVEQREIIETNPKNMDALMKKLDASVDIRVDNKINNGDDINASLKFRTMKDFNPDSIVKQVPELKKLLDVRESLVALKGPLGNLPNLRRTIQSKISDSSEKQKLLGLINKKNDS